MMKGGIVAMGVEDIILWQCNWFKLNMTILNTWIVMAVLVVASAAITRSLSPSLQLTHWQNLLEVIVLFLQQQVESVGLGQNFRYLSFLATLFLFIAVSALGNIVPGYESPTASLSTTVALAACVFVAVPVFGIWERGLGGYLRRYLEPTPLMLPFNIITELSRTLALAVRLFGNMISDVMVVGIILMVAPLFFPVLLQLLGLLTGFVQAYIFTVLAMVYIAAAVSGSEG